MPARESARVCARRSSEEYTHSMKKEQCCTNVNWKLKKFVPQANDEPFQVPISEENFDTYNFDPPPNTLETTKDQLKQLYRDMSTIRFVRSPGRLG